MYRQKFHVSFGGTLEDACHTFKFDYDKDLQHCEALTLTEEHGRTQKPVILLWFRDENPKPGVVAHECFHAVVSSLRERGMSLSAKSEEAYAYYLDWLVDKVHSLLEKQ